MKSLILSIFLVFAGFIVSAQTYEIKGTVVDTNGSPLPGVTIIVKNTQKGASTDFDGNFTISNVQNGETLVFSYIGYATKEINVTNNNDLNVTLEEDTQSLDEVVVIGYGTQKVTKVSGAISTVKTKEIEKQKPIRVEEALQGSASGVSVIQNGSPGSKPNVSIRGIPSFSGTDPVVIIDGVPQSLDDLNSINSADISSINILKDAASTAIYGVKGGNGVIVVTTRTGASNQKTEFSFNSYAGVQSVMKKIGVLNATEYGAMLNEGSVVSGGDLIFPDISVLGTGTDWQDEIFKTAGISSHNLSARGGVENFTYFLSTGYLGQDGIVGGGDKSNFNRLNVTANLNFQLSPKFKLILNTTYVNIKSKTVQENSFNSIIGSALNFDPTVSKFNTEPSTIGTYGYSDYLLSEIFNPLTKLADTYNESNGDKLYGKVELQYDVFKNFKLTTRFGYTKWDQKGKDFTPLVFYGPKNVSSQLFADGTVKEGEHNSVHEYSRSNFSFTYDTFANYLFDINEEHNFDVVAGISLSQNTGSGMDVNRQDVRDNSWAWADISGATGESTTENPNGQSGSSYKDLTRRNLSYFGRVNYDYDDKYLVSFSARRDGSIAFGPDNKFANFYAGSLGWVVSNEDFFDSEIIDFLKMRGSYGTVGNEDVRPQYVSIVTGGPSYGETANSNGYTFGGVFVPGATVNSFNNTTLRWEKQKQLNAGIDIRILNSLSLAADYFKKEVEGLLFTDAPPLIAGTSLPVAGNIGSTESKGVDLTLRYNTSTSKDFNFNTAITFTTSKNLVTATNSDGTAYVQGGSYFNGQSHFATRFEEGFTPGYFYGFQTNGLFQNQDEIDAHANQLGAQPGDIRFIDQPTVPVYRLNSDYDPSDPNSNEFTDEILRYEVDGVINDEDKTKIGDPFPKYTLGWNLGFDYKNFDLSVFTYFSKGNDIYRAYERNAQYSNKFRNVLDRWTGEGTTNDAKNPRYTFEDTNGNIRASDRYVEDGSFIKIKNVVFGYTIPNSKNYFINKIRLYAQVKNLFTFTNYTGYDPEISSGGILETGVDRGAYPQARTFTFGVDLKF